MQDMNAPWETRCFVLMSPVWPLCAVFKNDSLLSQMPKQANRLQPAAFSQPRAVLVRRCLRELFPGVWCKIFRYSGVGSQWCRVLRQGCILTCLQRDSDSLMVVIHAGGHGTQRPLFVYLSITGVGLIAETPWRVEGMKNGRTRGLKASVSH